MQKPSPPKWPKGVKISSRGWEHPDTGELLVSRRFTDQEIAMHNGTWVEPVPVPETIPETIEVEAPSMLTEAPAHGALEDMSKRQLEDLGRQHGIELDRRKNKAALIEELEEVL